MESLHSKVNEDSSDHRVQLCGRLQRNVLEIAEFVKKNDWSNEGLFKVNDTLNRHKYVYSVSLKSHTFMKTRQ